MCVCVHIYIFPYRYKEKCCNLYNKIPFCNKVICIKCNENLSVRSCTHSKMTRHYAITCSLDNLQERCVASSFQIMETTGMYFTSLCLTLQTAFKYCPQHCTAVVCCKDLQFLHWHDYFFVINYVYKIIL